MSLRILNNNHRRNNIHKNTFSPAFSPIPSGVPEKCKVINLKGEKDNTFTAIQRALELKYTNDATLIDHVIVLSYNENKSFQTFKKKHPGKKIIVYQLEQICIPGNLWWNDNTEHFWVRERTFNIKEWLNGCDVIWDMSLENIEFMVKQGIPQSKIIFKPIEYSDAFVYPVYDIIFVGSIEQKRLEYLNEVAKHFKLCVIGVWHLLNDKEKASANFELIAPKYKTELWGYINRAKIVLNIHLYALQEQVRIGELLANGKRVLSEKSAINYYGDLVPEFETKEQMISMISEMLSDKTFDPELQVEKYKRLDYSKFIPQKPQIKVGAIYNSFYDLELLETSINSIRSVVKYIVVIHQKISFAGEINPQGSLDILADLVKRGLIDDVVFYDNNSVNSITGKQNGVIEKRNIGLEMCRKNECEYIMPLDNDECYNASQLKKEVEFMKENNISTLYSKIFAYWYDEHYYFEDTYFVPSVYRVDERKFELTQTSVVCDPCRKMKEGKHRISEMPMHHLTYLKGHFEHKGVSNLRNVYYKDIFAQILSRFNSWQPGDKAAVFANDLTKGGELYVKEVELITTEKMF